MPPARPLPTLDEEQQKKLEKELAIVRDRQEGRQPSKSPPKSPRPKPAGAADDDAAGDNKARQQNGQ
jgi:hypothetical protein